VPDSLADYEPIIGRGAVEELRVVAERVRHLSLQNINSTAVGGGVAEILTRLVPLLADLGVSVTWDVIKGDEAFFNVTKAFHNALHGKAEAVTPQMLEIYRANTEMNLRSMEFTGDVIFVHDPQPAGLIAQKKKVGRRWVWRCHIDLSTPDPGVWEFLSGYTRMFDATIVSMPEFAQPMSIPQFLVAPSIDPLSDKNRDLSAEEVRSVLEKYRLDPERPILTQISRFDRLKDPVGVVAAYRIVRKRMDCQLVLAGGAATDDPEGAAVLDEVREAAAGDPDIHVLDLPPFRDLEINALVRGSTVVLQKSLKEGFGLTVSEALWKRKPVIGGAVGGIKIQVVNGVTGFLVHSPEGAAQRALHLLGDPGLRARMGENGYRHVLQNFLVTRHVKDYMLLMLALEHPDEDVVHLP
jgi:trehalose synthase